MLTKEFYGKYLDNCNSINYDFKTGLFRDENGKHFVIQNIRGDYVTTEIAETDYDKWFRHFAGNVLIAYDDTDACNPDEAEKIVAVEGYAFDIEQLFWDGEKLFIQYLNPSYSACQIVSTEMAKEWIDNHMKKKSIVHCGSLCKAIEKIDSYIG